MCKLSKTYWKISFRVDLCVWLLTLHFRALLERMFKVLKVRAPKI